MSSLRSRFARTIAREDVRAIARRYFVSNGFDGTLTGIGIVVGAVLSGIPSGTVVVRIGLSAAVGLGTSAVWSVWEIERAETRAEILRLEAAMLVDLDDTRIQREQTTTRLVHAAASGLGPLIGILLPLTPFVFEGSTFTMATAGAVSVAIAVCVLGAFGAYMGSISDQRWYVAAARMGLAGIVVAAINLVLPA
ncbi:VIT1/CCC1 transporter family protein [Halobaculum roseum]|uniref:VIT1/CCC1 transporter family protein n=1 Tax=Halobaculum roseum TaxID=2175149 RepID=A0ABD5MQ35_9EURY|nr:VIT1/CCC1 transporter family protein [Halobaculum roseum]QZY04636.1 VIT1/CCC1 transporter family protein [Halobaculum roseum]